MKNFIITLFFAAAVAKAIPATAQNKPYDFLVDGVKVVVQPSGNNIVSIETIIKGGVANYPADKMGIEALAMTALTECGTTKHDKNSFKNALDKVSASVYGFSSKDYSALVLNCLKGDLNGVWPLYSEALTMPAFDTAEFSRIKNDAITNLRQRQSSPDLSIDKMANNAAFSGHDYAKIPEGTPEIISNLTAAQTKAYYINLLTKSRLFVVVVADLPKAAIEAKVHNMLTGLKNGTPVEFKKATLQVQKNSFQSESKELATNYIEGVTSGPAVDSPDFYAFAVAMRIFADRHFLDIRTNNGLSYAPGAWFSAGATSVAKFSVSTTQPDKYIAVFDKLVDSTKKQGFTASELANMKVTYLTGFYYKNETNQAQASSIASNEVLHGDWRKSLTLVDDVKKITLNDVNSAFNKYIGNMVWVYQGDTKKVSPLLYTNGTLNASRPPVSN